MLRSCLIALLIAAAPAPGPAAADAPGLRFEDRVSGELAVARARYRFVLNATQPFDEAYPRQVFEERVRLHVRKERALQSAFGATVDRSHLAEEYARIEKATRAPEHWQAVKEALGGNRSRIEEIVCRPLVVDRLLRLRFDLDRAVHAGEHQRARAARADFMAGRTPAGAAARLLEPAQEKQDLDEMLSKAKAEAIGPRVLKPAAEQGAAEPLPVSPTLLAVLEQELKASGDVTTVLEDRAAFQVMRLAERRGRKFKVDAVVVPKRPFEAWLDEVAPR